MHGSRAVNALTLGILLTLAATGPAPAQDIADERAAIEAAALDADVYRALWCAASYALLNARQTAAAEPGAARQSATARDRLYRRAATALVAAGASEAEFTALAESVHAIAEAQEQSSVAANRDFTEGECAAASAAAH